MSNVYPTPQEKYDSDAISQAHTDVVEFLKKRNSHLVALQIFSCIGFYFTAETYNAMEFEPVEVHAVRRRFTFRQRYVHLGHVFGLYSVSPLYPDNSEIEECCESIQYEVREAVLATMAIQFKPKKRTLPQLSPHVITSEELRRILDENHEISYLMILHEKQMCPIHISHDLIREMSKIYLLTKKGTYIVITLEDVNEEDGLTVDPRVFMDE